MIEERINNLIGEIAAIQEEIEEFSAQGDDVSSLIAEQQELLATVERYLVIRQIKASRKLSTMKGRFVS